MYDKKTPLLHVSCSASSSVIGQLESCPHEALEAWAEKAVSHYGDVSTWDSAVFAEVGILIGE